MRYVVSHNRDRDSYQVALALNESKKLARLVTDIYVPPESKLACFPKLAKRYVAGLPGTAVSSCLTAFFVQMLLFVKSVSRRHIFSFAQRAISRKAGKIAHNQGCGLLAYSDHADLAFKQVSNENIPKILFMYHPHYLLIEKLLKEDQQNWPMSHMLPEPELLYDWSEKQAADGQIQMADLIVCASTFTKRSLCYAGVRADRIHVIPYGVRPVAEIVVTERRSAGVRFLFVGQGRQRKGLHILFEAWRALGLSNATLTCVCYSMDPAIVGLTPPGVEILPKLSASDLAAEYQRADVFVMPSLIEGFGLVYLEALSMGCYVIGTENTGLPDLNAPEWAARTVPAGEVDALVSAIMSTYEMVANKQLNRSAIRDFCAAFTWELFRSRLNRTIESFEAGQEEEQDV